MAVREGEEVVLVFMEPVVARRAFAITISLAAIRPWINISCNMEYD
jgi:hypothetical protein